MVARVIVFLRLIDFKASIAVIMLPVEVKNFKLSVLLNRTNHILWRLLPSSDVRLVIPQQHKLLKRLCAQVNLVLIILKDSYYITREVLRLLTIPDVDVRVNEIPLHTVAVSQG
mgnify:CR=1 FL=1